MTIPFSSLTSSSRFLSLPKILLLLLIVGSTLLVQYSFLKNKSNSSDAFLTLTDTIHLSLIDHLGGEYNCIAQAIYQGKGFSNPFCQDTGPTAWMPPVLPAFLAGCYWVFHGEKTLVALLYSWLGASIFMWIGFFLLANAEQTHGSKGAWLMLGVYACLLIANFYRLFQLSHDIPIVAGAVLLMYRLVQWVWNTDLNLKPALIWGGGGGLLPLINPVLGLLWGTFHIWILVEGPKYIGQRKFFKRWCLVGLLFILPTGLWTIRNKVQMKALIPIKGNLFFDLYQGNVLANQGIVDFDLFSHHPLYANQAASKVYAHLGEVSFSKLCKSLFIGWLRNNPVAFFRNVKNRFLEAFFIYHPFRPLWELYTFVPQAIMTFLFGCSFFYLFFTGLQQLSNEKIIALVQTSLFLFPYIAISYYSRYGLHLLALQGLIIYWALAKLLWGK